MYNNVQRPIKTKKFINKEKIKSYKLSGGIVATIDNDETWVFSNKPELMSENKVDSWTQINEIL